MSGITFTRRVDGDFGRVRESSATLPSGEFLTIGASLHSDRIDLGLMGDMAQCWMVFTVEQARSVAAELVACADARDAAQGRA
ncbi:hypothetical protein [Oryzisolibacter sp. LB2S]|uniref:hypothetical protein n=1 Tax=Alicycliphilus soli TaxID=3228789 RepID=UPI003458647F